MTVRTDGARPARRGGSRAAGTVLHVTECDGGGVLRAVEQAVAATPEYDHVVLCPARGGGPARLGDDEWRMPRGFLSRVRGIERVAWATGADVVHAHSTWAGVYARAARLATPVLYQPHCFAFEDVTAARPVRGAYRLAERLMAPRAAAVLALTPREEELARDLGARAVEAVVNAPTVDAPTAETRAGYAGSTGARASSRPEHRTTRSTVAMVGRISPQKDPRFFARVAEAVRATDPDVGFRWIGDGDSGARRALESAGVEVTGWLDDLALADALGEADLYLHSAVYEGFPLSVLDAAAQGVPVVVRDIPAVRHTSLRRVTTEAEAVAVVRALGDPDLVADLAHRTRTLALSMTRDAHREALLEVYGRWVGRPAAPRADRRARSTT
ncbi:glycosyltransferase [Cellulosimicrobium sp. Marseille-Q8652]